VALHLAGVDLTLGTADDAIEVITGIGAVPAVISLGAGPSFAGRMGLVHRVGPTTVAMASTGPDTIPGNADDRLVVWQSALTVPVTKFVPTGAMMTDPDSQVVATGSDAALVPLRGADLVNFTADDQVAFAFSLSAAVIPAATNLAAGNPAPGMDGRLVVLSTSAAVRISRGADGTLGTPDDGLTLLTALTGAGATSTFATARVQSALPLVLSATSAVLVGLGTDGLSGTADDLVLEITGIGVAPTLATTSPGPFRLSGPGAIVPNGAASVLLARTAGPDGAAGTADDPLSTAPLP